MMSPPLLTEVIGHEDDVPSPLTEVIGHEDDGGNTAPLVPTDRGYRT